MTSEENGSFKEPKWRKTTKRSTAINIMRSNADKPPKTVIELISDAINVDCKEARSYYNWIARNNMAPGEDHSNGKKMSANANNSALGDIGYLSNFIRGWLNEQSSTFKEKIEENKLLIDLIYKIKTNNIVCDLTIDEGLFAVSLAATPEIKINFESIGAIKNLINESQLEAGILTIRDDGAIFFFHSFCFENEQPSKARLDWLFKIMEKELGKILIRIENIDVMEIAKDQTSKDTMVYDTEGSEEEIDMENNHAETLRKTLSEVFEKLMLSFDVDEDGDFYITEGLAFPGWVYVIQDGALIKIWSFLAFKDEENVDTQAADNLANRINQEYLPNAVYHKNGRLYFQYFYPSKFDFNEKQFVNMLRRSFESFVASIRACDDDDLLP